MEADEEPKEIKTVTVYLTVLDDKSDEHDASICEDASSSEVLTTERPPGVSSRPTTIPPPEYLAPAEVPPLVTPRPTMTSPLESPPATEIPPPVVQYSIETPPLVTTPPTEIPPPVTPCPAEISPPVTPHPHPGKSESSEGQGTGYEEIRIDLSEYEEIVFDGTEYDEIPCNRIKCVETEMDKPPIPHGTGPPGTLIHPRQEAVSPKIPVRRCTVILASTLVFAAVTVASIIGGTLILGKDT